MSNYFYVPSEVFGKIHGPDTLEEDIVEVIIKHNGDLQSICELVDALWESLSENFAILTMSSQMIPVLLKCQTVQHVEFPKKLTFFLQKSLEQTYVTPVQRETPFGLSGQGILIGIIDSGIDYAHPDFRNEDGSSRILSLWDQTIEGSPPQGFLHGTVYEKETLDQALLSSDPYSIVPSQDVIGHGTVVAGIAAGNGRSDNGINRGVAPEASLVVVKLNHLENAAYTQTVDIMRAARFIYDVAESLNIPLCLNISYGTNDGSHEGTSLFESYMDDLSELGKSVICVAAGNEGSAGHHFYEKITDGGTLSIEFAIGEELSELYMTLWKNFTDTVSFELISPGGHSTGRITPYEFITEIILDDTMVAVVYNQPSHFNGDQEVYFSLRVSQGTLTQGIWTLIAQGDEIVDGAFDIWLPTLEAVSNKTAFLQPSPENTISIPATAKNVISVGGYNSIIGTSADFSGRGKLYNSHWQKPDLVAPAVSILAPVSGGGYDSFTGTSVAAPFITGASALMLEWAHTQGNDFFLYGQRVKAFLCRNANRTFPLKYPNSLWGYGTLNLYKTMMDLVAYTR